jgi:hypothetical protein
MARAAIGKVKSVGRPPSGRSMSVKGGPVKQRGAAKAVPITASASKEELRARVEKLERANATLRVKNKELRIVAVESAEQVDALTLQLASSERRAGRNGRHEEPAEALTTREIVRAGRGKRKAREAAETSEDDGEGIAGDGRTVWRGHDQAEA